MLSPVLLWRSASRWTVLHTWGATISTQQTCDEKENIHPNQGAAQPVQNAIVRSRSRLALSTSLRRSTSSKTLIAKQASAADVPFADVPASLRKAGSLRSDPESKPRPTNVEEDDELVPTEPNTPFPVISPSVLRSPAFSSQSSSAEPGSADARLQRLCERAKASRARIWEANEDGGEAALFEDAFVIGSEMRLRIVEWLLTFLPSKRRHSQLYDQLATSPETRFQAVVLFLACLKQTVKESNWGEFVDERIRKRLVADEAKEGGTGVGDQAGAATGTQTSAHDAEYDYETDLAEYEAEELVDGLRLIVWDTAVGALALSVKECQRDVLRSVNYTFGVTPQPLMDNVWLAVPELQSVLDYETQEEAENQQADAEKAHYLETMERCAKKVLGDAVQGL
ncbi:uncharacterized protein SCHCODRAFT_01154428 [Schizophyllum commune H4-8]|uniref:Expressed protein n=1 Tax=Schizophyllum commune (strain H4-8 / FGSC 9210) TaxID=578458 RepID=D8Q7K3_SCHCM|nr:uncharacterized protein SCHCODRAFT_01154428 [Schizophyllum commune H4-8]KAI5891454.1 hypothetical protein SCHCODRAFT_01154428 [Schizophyllum commune H4-8]